MPSMSNITVKKFDGTTDVTFTALAAASGDKTAARWRNNAASTVPGYRPEYSMTSRQTSAGKRESSHSFIYPCLTPVNGVIPAGKKVVITMTVRADTDVDQGDINEAVYQHHNLVASALIKSADAELYAPS